MAVMEGWTTLSRMPRAIFSDSTAYRVEECAAAAVLPRADSAGDKARLGSAFHEHREYLTTHGYPYAFKAIPWLAEKWRVDRLALARMAAGCKWAPPKGCLVEVSLACLQDGAVVRVEGGHGRYPDMPQGAFAPGQLDVMWSEPEPLRWVGGVPVCPEGSVLFVADYKTGDPDGVPPVERNAQLSNLAYKAARWTRAEAVVPAIIFIDWQGESSWDTPPGPLYEDDLVRIWEDIVLRQERAEAQLDALETAPSYLARREALTYSPGAHCTWCKSRFACPAVVGEVRALLEAPPDGTLSVDEAAHLARMVPLVEALAKKVKDTLKGYVEEHGPIPVGEGEVWGPHEVAKERVSARLALPVLVQQLQGSAFDAVDVSKAAIDRVAKAKGLDKKAVKAIFGKLRGAGAFEQTTETWWSTYRMSSSTEGIGDNEQDEKEAQQ